MNSYTEKNNKTPELQQNLALLNELPFFSSFPAKAMKLIAFLAERNSFSAGDILFDVGDDHGQAYLVLSGQIGLYRRVGRDKQVVASFSQNDFLGSLSLLGSLPSLFLLQAQEDSTLLSINRKEFSKILQQFPETMDLVLKATLNELYQWERKNMNQAEECCLKRAGATVL